MDKIAIFASHNGSGFEAILEAIACKKLHLKIAFVVSNNTDAPVLQKAKYANIPAYLVNSKHYNDPDKKIYQLLKKHSCKYIFLSGYMKKIPANITKNFHVINSHPSLLPNYGGNGMYGRYVHEAVIANMESKSGVTIHYVNEFYDDGKIILQKELTLSKNENVDSLEQKIKKLEKVAIVEGLIKCLN